MRATHQLSNEGEGGLKELLRANVDINTPDEDGRTALHRAALVGSLRVATLLVANKADLDLKGNWGGTPLDLAEGNGHSEVAAFLREQRGAAQANRTAAPAARAPRVQAARQPMLGKVIILVFGNYDGDYNRGVAAQQEVESGRRFAQALGCEVRELTDAFDGDVEKMSKDKVRGWLMSQVAWLKNARYCVFIGAGHGGLGTLQCIDHEILSETHDIEDPISTALGGKTPKIYIYQHCMGATQNNHKTWADGPVNSHHHRLSESIRFYATAPDFSAYRSNGDSPFLRTAADVIEANPNASLSEFEHELATQFQYKFNQVPQVMADAGANRQWRFQSGCI